MRKLLVALFGLLIMSAPAGAQDSACQHQHRGGCPDAALRPQRCLRHRLERWDRRDVQCVADFGLQAEYMYNWMPGPEKTILVSPVPGGATSAQLIESNHNIHSVTFNGLVSSPRSRDGWRIRRRWHRLLSSDSTADVTRRRVRHGLRSVLVLVLSGGGVG